MLTYPCRRSSNKVCSCFSREGGDVGQIGTDEIERSGSILWLEEWGGIEEGGPLFIVRVATDDAGEKKGLESIADLSCSGVYQATSILQIVSTISGLLNVFIML